MRILMVLLALATPSFAGDLVIAGYGDSLAGNTEAKWCGHVQAPHSCDWTYAVPGERTQDGSARLIADLAAGRVASETTHITLAWGANDIRRSALDWDADFEQPLRDAAEAVLDAGFEPVLVVTLDQYQTSPGQSPDECDPFPALQQKLDAEFSPRIYEIADDYDPPLIVADLHAAYDAVPESTKCPGAWRDGFYKDHVHQMDAGYQFMADEVVAAAVPESGLGRMLAAGIVLLVRLRVGATRHATNSKTTPPRAPPAKITPESSSMSPTDPIG